MKKWRVYGAVQGSKYLGEIEAETKEEAEKKAWDLDECCVCLCHHCSAECEDPEIDSIVLEEIK